MILKPLTELLENIDERAARVWSAQNDPETLSKVILELSGINMALGEYLAAARADKASMKTEYEYNYNMAKLKYISDGLSATHADSQAKVDFYELRKVLDQRTEYVAMLTAKRKDTEQIINDGKARLGVIREDMRHG
jgi:hypothetical protein